MIFTKPHLVLLVFMTAMMLFISLAIEIKGEAMLSLVPFFASCVFPALFTRCVDQNSIISDVARDATSAGVVIKASVLGG
jgi:hypothetical protein